MPSAWEVDDGLIEVTSGFRGVTIPLGDLQAEIARQGWELGKVEFKDDEFVAQGSSPQGETVESAGPTDQTAVANLLMTITRKNFIRSAAQVRVGMWQSTFTDKLQEIAEAYMKAPVYDPKAAGAWQELAADSMRRAQAIQQQIQVEVVNEPEPYANAQEMCKDIHENQHFLVSRAHCEHPLWSTDQNVAFRIVHDVLGHAVSGGDFGWVGENLACAAHFPLLSPTAQKALFTECIAQTGYALYYKGFGPQKICFMDEYLDPVQAEENPDGHWGVHPSQSIIPKATPQLPVSEPMYPENKRLVPPHLNPAFGPQPFAFAAFTGRKDPNDGWQPTNIPRPAKPAAQHHGDPLDAYAEGSTSLMDTAAKIDTGWYHQSESEQKQAIVNAFRVALLSPQKDLKWNAVHYQDISHIPADVDDPMVYWRTLQERRKAWNEARVPGRDPMAHLPYFYLLPEFYGMLKYQNPKQGDHDIRALADELIMNWHANAEENIEMEDNQKDKPASKRMSAPEIESQANKEVEKHIKTWLGNYTEDTDHPGKEHPEQGQLSILGADRALPGQVDLEGNVMPEDTALYGAFMANHLHQVAQISKHADALLEAAQEDVRDHDGSGHHFRAAALHLAIPGVGPKVASFSWLLLQPMTSQLATIDTHMLNVLGGDETSMNPRDYFKFERMLAAGKEASGYSHVPLGAFQWGMWDAKRSGIGQHQDHSAMKVLNPTPHHHIDWAGKAKGLDADWSQAPPIWWADTQPARDQVAREFDEEIGQYVRPDVIPYQRTSKTAAPSEASPWFRHQDGEGSGKPGQSVMALLREHYGELSTPEIWELELEAGKQ